MKWEQEAANDLGIPWTSQISIPESSETSLQLKTRSAVGIGLIPKLRTWIKLRSSIYKDLLAIENNYDVILLRYSVHDVFLLWYLGKTTKPLILVHHAIERKELLLEGSVLGIIRATLEYFIGGLVNNRASGQISVTPEILESISVKKAGKSFTYIYPNGIKVSEAPRDSPRTFNPEFLFISSSFQPWHGLDRLVEAMKNNGEDFKVHLIGFLTTEQIKTCQNDDRFVLHGLLESTQILSIAEQCNVGIASLAMDRNGLTQGSTLKVREYLNMGLPVVADHDDIFPREWPFFQTIRTNPDHLVADLLSFAKTQEVYSKIKVKELAKPFIDKTQLLKNLYSELSHYFA